MSAPRRCGHTLGGTNASHRSLDYIPIGLSIIFTKFVGILQLTRPLAGWVLNSVATLAKGLNQSEELIESQRMSKLRQVSLGEWAICLRCWVWSRGRLNTSIWIPIIKILWSHDCVIFIIKISVPIPYFEMGPWSPGTSMSVPDIFTC